MHKNRAILLESWPGDVYKIHECSQDRSGSYNFYGTIYPFFSENHQFYAVKFQRCFQVSYSNPEQKEILLEHGKTPDVKDLSALVHRLAKREAMKIARIRKLKLRTMHHSAQR